MESPPEKKQYSSNTDGVREAVFSLDEDFRLPVILHYMEGYKTREIARILKIPEGTVKTRLARAKQKLKRLLEEEEA